MARWANATPWRRAATRVFLIGLVYVPFGLFAAGWVAFLAGVAVFVAQIVALRRVGHRERLTRGQMVGAYFAGSAANMLVGLVLLLPLVLFGFVWAAVA